MEVLFSDLWNLLKHDISRSTLILMLASGGLVVIYFKVKMYVTKLDETDVKLKKDVELLKKRVTKIINFMHLCPSVTPKVELWLKDDTRNSQPPEGSACTECYKQWQSEQIRKNK